VPGKRKPSLKRLYATLKDAPANIASLKVSPDGGFEVSFRVEPTVVSPDPRHLVMSPMPPSKPVKLIPGTPFPDDDSPIDLADLTLTPPDLDESN
jgi:hypothetical protein